MSSRWQCVQARQQASLLSTRLLRLAKVLLWLLLLPRLPQFRPARCILEMQVPKPRAVPAAAMQANLLLPAIGTIPATQQALQQAVQLWALLVKEQQASHHKQQQQASHHEQQQQPLSATALLQLL
jgi:hypothetical protein